MFRNIALLTLFVLFSTSIYAQSAYPKFTQYRVSVFKGKKKWPTWLTKKTGDCWRDQLGKCTDDREINFAGKYFLAQHSCGTNCRYYTLTDLSSGHDLKTLDRFASGEKKQRLNGREYVAFVYVRPYSKLLVAQYSFQTEAEKLGGELYGYTMKDCREQSFVLSGSRLKSITKINKRCRKLP